MSYNYNQFIIICILINKDYSNILVLLLYLAITYNIIIKFN